MKKTKQVNPEFHAQMRTMIDSILRRLELTKKLENETMTTDEFSELMALLANKRYINNNY